MSLNGPKIRGISFGLQHLIDGLYFYLKTVHCVAGSCMLRRYLKEINDTAEALKSAI